MAGRLGPGVGVRIGWVAAEGDLVFLIILDTKPHVCIARHTHTQGAGFASGGVRGAAGREHYHSTAGLERRRRDSSAMLSAFLLAAAASVAAANPTVTFDTSMGSFSAELYLDRVPRTVRAYSLDTPGPTLDS